MKFKVDHDYRVQWVDSSTLGEGWFKRKVFLHKAKHAFTKSCVSVGKVIADRRDYVVLASAQDTGDPESFFNAHMIPKCAIIKAKQLH